MSNKLFLVLLLSSPACFSASLKLVSEHSRDTDVSGETLFNHRTAELSGRTHAKDAYGAHPTFASPQAARDAGFDIDHAQSENPTEVSYKRQFARFPVEPSPISQFFSAYKDIFLYILVLGTLWVLLFNSMVFGAELDSSAATLNPALELLPGNSWKSPNCSSYRGSLWSGIRRVSRTHQSLLDQRNGRVREPAHILPNCILPTIFLFMGMVIYGAMAADPTRYTWVGMHAGFALFYFGFCAISAVTGVWLGELFPHMSGPAIVLTCGMKKCNFFSVQSFVQFVDQRDIFTSCSEAYSLHWGLSLFPQIRRAMEMLQFLGTY